MSRKPAGLRGFILIWVGQVLSMVSFFSFAPLILFFPIAGVLVDRWNRKLVMALSDIGAGVVTLAIFILLMTGNLEIWHLYVTGMVGGLFGAFQWLAYSAAITLMVPKKHYARASGMFRQTIGWLVYWVRFSELPRVVGWVY